MVPGKIFFLVWFNKTTKTRTVPWEFMMTCDDVSSCGYGPMVPGKIFFFGVEPTTGCGIGQYEASPGHL